ncbi:hypothetical protein [Methylobacterium oxalidis]|uniref:hypothetical protein n=1 Tax=Methylobacterium oxalidis TaxID=944322 RepID=UPI00331543C9
MAVPAPLPPSSQIETLPAALVRAVADANRLRALARVALRDGAPMPELRAFNARAAARRVLAHARTLLAREPALAREPEKAARPEPAALADLAA